MHILTTSDVVSPSAAPGAVTILLFILAALIVKPAQAQMFSADQRNQQRLTPTTSIYAGIEALNFDYDGERTVPGAADYQFSGSIFRLRFEGAGTRVFVGFGGSATGLGDISYFDAGIRYGYGLDLYRSDNLSLQIPVVLQSTFTSVNDENVVVANAPQFTQGTLELGSGLLFGGTLAPQMRFALRAVPSYGFTFSTTDRDGNGSIAAAKGEARLYFDHLFGSSGLSIGYDYNGRTFDVESEQLNYNSVAHTFLIGITF